MADRRCCRSRDATPATGQIPQRIFIVDSLEDADLRNGVPFGGFDDE